MVKRSIIFVTSYPEKGEIHSATTVGVASYAKQLAQDLGAQNKELEIEVVAEKLTNQSDTYAEHGVRIGRTWWRGSILSLLGLLGRLLRAKERRILVSLEINMFGGVGHTVMMLLGLAILRLCGKEIVIIAHQVPPKSTRGGIIYRIGWHLGVKGYYGLLKLAGTKIVVFEQYLADSLKTKKAVVIPHALPVTKGISRGDARKILGWNKNSLYALCLGYIAPYKGILRLIKNWNDENVRLVIAGGINPNHAHNHKVQDYVAHVTKAAKVHGVEMMGFVEEDNLENYFAACDVVLLPYEMMFSSSGPLAWGIAYEKSIILSHELGAYLRSHDLREAMNKAKLKRNDVLADFDRGINFAVKQAVQNKSKWQEFGKEMKMSRNWQVVGAKFLEAIHEE